ncbi:DUF1697 domain-containing protein [Arthrobacter sp. TMN-37]
MTGAAAAPAARFAVFLRGVNVQGTTLRMADLKRALEGLPLSHPRTLLASGNVVCSSVLPPHELKDAVEQRLRSAFGYDAWVVVLTAERVAELLEACPFAADDPAVHAYITLSSDAAAVDELAAEARAADEELVILGPDAVAWQAPRGGTLDSGLGRITAKTRFRTATTTRNLRTLAKVHAALRD